MKLLGFAFKRFMWWAPWHLTSPWVPRIWRGGDECGTPTLCFTVPPFGCFIFFRRKSGAQPQDKEGTDE